MAIDFDRLMRLLIPDCEQSYTERDTMLYALGLGFGLDPADRGQLCFVFERDLQALPTFAVVLAHPGFWLRDLDTGVTWVKAVHGEQGVTLGRPLPVAGTVIGTTRITDVIDKGAGVGALLLSERELFDKSSGDRLATITQSYFCRADGGFGGPPRPSARAHPLPERAADHIVDLPTSSQAALIYRLSGDRNPLHADPDVAMAAGFPRPILHGLATFGAAGHAVLREVCGYQPDRLKSIRARFTAPVLPGDTLRTEVWRDGDIVSFRMRCVERDALVLSNGRAEIA